MRKKASWLIMLVVIAMLSSAIVSLTGPATASAPQVQGIDGNTIKVGGMNDALRVLRRRRRFQRAHLASEQDEGTRQVQDRLHRVDRCSGHTGQGHHDHAEPDRS